MNECKIIIDIEMMIRSTAWSSPRVCYLEINVNVVIATNFFEKGSLKAPDEASFRFRKHPKYNLNLPGFFGRYFLKHKRLLNLTNLSSIKKSFARNIYKLNKRFLSHETISLNFFSLPVVPSWLRDPDMEIRTSKLETF